MIKTFENFNNDIEQFFGKGADDDVRKLVSELSEIEYILKDDGIKTVIIEYVNRKFKFPQGIYYAPVRLKMHVHDKTIEEVMESDFLGEWIDRASEICEKYKMKIHATSTDFKPLIYFYYK